MSSQSVCKACILLEGLNRGLPKLGIGNEKKIRREHLEKSQAAESVDGVQHQLKELGLASLPR